MNRDERIELDRSKFGLDGPWSRRYDPVLFYKPKDYWGGFSNFSLHSVELRNPFTQERTVYATVEHRYQAMKATNLSDHLWVAGLDDLYGIPPHKTKARGRQVQLRPDWGSNFGDFCYFVMFEAVLAKMKEHDGPRNILFRSRERLLYEDSPTDDIWGWRSRDGQFDGRNLLGVVLMEVRKYL